jgi:hypothetical protein
MEKQSFTEAELQEIKAIQEEYNAIGVQLVQLKLAVKSTKEYMEALAAEETRLEELIEGVNQKERGLTDSLNEKYGAGSLDLATGEFTPNS